jgi:hypothetical protein
VICKETEILLGVLAGVVFVSPAVIFWIRQLRKERRELMQELEDYHKTVMRKEEKL